MEFPLSGTRAVKDAPLQKDAPGDAPDCDTCVMEESDTRQLTTDGVERTILCPKCNETFTFIDNGTRPFRTICPHCGVKGVLE